MAVNRACTRKLKIGAGIPTWFFQVSTIGGSQFILFLISAGGIYSTWRISANIIARLMPLTSAITSVVTGFRVSPLAVQVVL